LAAFQNTSCAFVRRAYPPRKNSASKGDFGKVLAVGGSRTFSGSPIFNCLGAYAAGADLVTLLAPRRAADIAAKYAPEIIAPPLDGDYLAPKFVSEIVSYSKRSDSMVIGGGLCRKPETQKAVLAILKRTAIPVVVDADALRFLAAAPISFSGRASILTPHAGELAALLGKKSIPSDNLPARIESAKAAASKYSSVVLLKGAVDVIADPQGKVMLDLQGSPYLTKGGHGDVIAGICAALLARKLPAFESAATAAYIYGKAGALAAKESGESTKPTDVLAKIPMVIAGRK
jgi:hydroxyethylthiazole kinase-like uncharacterized protein yjeF